MSLYATAVKKPVTTALVFVAIVIFGLFSLTRLSVDLLPEIETNTIMVMTSYAGASAADIEMNVSKPLENVLNSVSDLKHITSQSRENISIITLEFDYGTDIDVATCAINWTLPSQCCRMMWTIPLSSNSGRTIYRLSSFRLRRKRARTPYTRFWTIRYRTRLHVSAV
mgnify:CR=1 FL=1